MKTYILREQPAATELTELGSYSHLLQKLLYFRNIKSADEAEVFLKPNYERHSHDPLLMKGMTAAVERILQAVERNERILIYSDYDADGIPAAVVLTDLFRAINYTNFEVYIPHRHTEGYGLHLEAIETFPARGIKLIITLDCGIVDHAEVAHAQKLGIDVIVTDHRLPGEILPKAYAVINSKQSDCEYPEKMLCGAAVGYKLTLALLAKNRFGLAVGKEKWWLDMVGIATLSDMVPLVGENRVLAHYGLKVLRKSPRLGLARLLRLIRVDQKNLTEDDVGFMITPRINAASRMGTPLDAYELLSATDEAEAGRLAQHLEEINQERKTRVAVLVKEVKKHVAAREITDVIVAGNPDWRPALLGLVASSIAEEYNRPVFLWGREEGQEIKGSCRSDGSVDVVKLMSEAAGTFSQFGGHKMAGGFAVSSEHIHALETELLNAYSKVKESTAVEEEFIDTILSIDDVTEKTYNDIEQLGPFGVGNAKPLFLIKNQLIAETRSFGKRQEHLELLLPNSRQKMIKAIAFFAEPQSFTVQPKKSKTVDILATMEKSFFGRPEIRLRIVDIL